MPKLLGLIKEMDAAEIPMFGACFGHQAIALALGGTIGRNPGGWVHGLTRNKMLARPNWARDLPDEVKLYASHVEQVSALPNGAEVLSESDGCSVTSFAIGGRIYTTQHHPEMTADFIAALTDELAPAMGSDLAATARKSLAEASDMEAFATSVALFFEQAMASKTP